MSDRMNDQNHKPASVSKGVFVYKGKRSLQKPDTYIARTAEHDVDPERVHRMSLFNDLSNKTNAKLQDLQTSLNNRVFSDLMNYIGNVHKSHYLDKPRLELPAAAVVTGVNVPDHAVMFESLKLMIKDRITTHVVSLRSTTCQTIKAIIASTVTQLLPLASAQAESDDEDEDFRHTQSSQTLQNVQIRRKISNKNMFDVVSWYKHQYEDLLAASDHCKLSPRRANSGLHYTGCKTPSKTESSSTNGQFSSTRKRSLSVTHPVDVCSPKKCPLSPRYGGVRSVATPKKSSVVDEVLNSPLKITIQLTRCDSTPCKLDFRNQSMADVQPNSVPSKTESGSQNINNIPSTRPVPVVIVLEDFEGFNSRVLQDFITICRCHLHEVPFVLVFGIATTINVVHRMLPHRVSSLLSIEKFLAPLSSEYFSLVLDQILFNSNFPFKLGPKVFSFLLDVFLFHDFSVLSFIRSYNYAMMEHFYCNPLSVFCQSLDDAINHVETMTAVQVENVRSSTSFQRFVKNLPVDEQRGLKCDKQVKEVLKKLLTSLNDYNRCFYPILSCLHILTQKLPTCPLGKQLRELYASCLMENVYESSGYKQSLALLRTLSRDEFIRLLLQTQESLSLANVADLNPVLLKVQEFLNKFITFDEDNAEKQADDPEETLVVLPKKTNIYELRQKLKELDQQQKQRKTTVYDKLRNEIVDYMDSVFCCYLSCPASSALHEALYYDDVGELKKRLYPNPRAVVQSALSDPYQYLKIDSLNVADGQISADMPDICIVYKLHLECGRVINLYDWLMAFAVTIQTKDPTAVGEDGKPSKTVQARFTRAVSELNYIGFIKQTKRRVDHVERLTWGPC